MSDQTQVLDTSDLDKHVGEEVGGGQLKEPIALIDIRRWVQTMDYLNPRHFDEEAAKLTRFGEIVAPQSFMVCCDVGHGAAAAIVGRIPGSHVVFGGDEFWFYGPRIRAGDLVRVKRRFDGYTLSDTKFAGPTIFSRGDTTYYNQRQESIGKQRSTMVRYLPHLARERGHYGEGSPTWTEAKLAEIERQRVAWVASNRNGEGPGNVTVGDTLPVRPMGPHTQVQFAIEYRTFMFSTWGTYFVEEPYYGNDAGWLTELTGDTDDDRPNKIGGMDQGPASGHTHASKANLVGIPRHYGYGSSMGAWVIDYVAYWAGDNGFVRHSKINYRYPTFEGDVAVLHGVVEDVRWEPLLGVNVAKIDISMVNQDEVVLASGYVEVELPIS
jgi:acyl dehydratase